MLQNQRLLEQIKSSFSQMDKIILLITYALVTLSTIFVYSATRKSGFVGKNIMWIAIGTILVIIISFIDYREVRKYTKHIYGICIILLLVVRFLGKKTLGAQRWISIGPFQLQPSEFVKIAIIIMIAYRIANEYKEGINNLMDIVTAVLPVSPLILLILIQPDLGTTLITVSAYVFMIFLYGANMKPIWIIGTVILLSIYPVYRFVLSDYQKTRVETFLNPAKGIAKGHYLGTDNLGRDLFARLSQGIRISMELAIVTAAICVVFGTIYGAVSAYFGGIVDTIMTRFVEILMIIPSMIYIILLMVIMGNGIKTIIIIIRLTTDIPNIIFTEAFLSFIGLGVPIPQASLGNLVYDGSSNITSYPYLFIIPSVVISLITLSFNIIGDALNDALNPKLRS